MHVIVTHLVEDQGSVLIFEGETLDGRTVRFAADHRPGGLIVDALSDGEDIVVADVPSWAVLSLAVSGRN